MYARKYSVTSLHVIQGYKVEIKIFCYVNELISNSSHHLLGDTRIRRILEIKRAEHD
jgi:hypothetical protein